MTTTATADPEQDDNPAENPPELMKHAYQPSATEHGCLECGYDESDHDASLTVTTYATDADGEQVAVDVPVPPSAPVLPGFEAPEPWERYEGR
ncbi:MAG: hypothetical protein RLZZ200_2633, partial [Pseudomonadota bacterium]